MTLLSHINGQFGKKLTDLDLQGILDKLVAAKVIEITRRRRGRLPGLKEDGLARRSCGLGSKPSTQHMAAADLSPEYLAALRRMTGAQKLRTAFGLYWSVRKLKAAWLREQHPDWTEERVQQRVKEIFMHAVT